MKRYKKTGNTGVSAYEAGPDYIKVKFHDNKRTYTYNYRSAGLAHVEKMKQLAEQGSGLSTYINKYVKDLYA